MFKLSAVVSTEQDSPVSVVVCWLVIKLVE